MDSHFYREVAEFVIEQAALQPLSKRIRLYRGLSKLCGDEVHAPQLEKLANDLEAADLRCREFAFRFSQGGGK